MGRLPETKTVGEAGAGPVPGEPKTPVLLSRLTAGCLIRGGGLGTGLRKERGERSHSSIP